MSEQSSRLKPQRFRWWIIALSVFAITAGPPAYIQVKNNVTTQSCQARIQRWRSELNHSKDEREEVSVFFEKHRFELDGGLDLVPLQDFRPPRLKTAQILYGWVDRQSFDFLMGPTFIVVFVKCDKRRGKIVDFEVETENSGL